MADTCASEFRARLDITRSQSPRPRITYAYAYWYILGRLSVKSKPTNADQIMEGKEARAEHVHSEELW